MTLLIATMWDMLNQLTASLEQFDIQSNKFITVGTGLCSIMMVINLVRRYQKNIHSDEPDFDMITSLWYPILITILLGLYSPIVNSFDDLATNSVTSLLHNPFLNSLEKSRDATEKQNKDDEEAYKKVNDNAASQADEGTTHFNQGDYTTINTTKNDIGEVRAEKEPSGWIAGGLWKLWKSILKFLIWVVGVVCCVALYVVYKVNFLFLKIFGPISIGISVIPEYRQSLPNFFYKLFTYAMYPIMGGIIIDIAGRAIDAMPIDTFNLSFEFAGIVVVFMVVGFFQIPKVAASIITLGSGVGASKAGSMAQSGAARIATKAITKI